MTIAGYDFTITMFRNGRLVTASELRWIFGRMEKTCWASIPFLGSAVLTVNSTMKLFKGLLNSRQLPNKVEKSENSSMCRHAFRSVLDQKLVWIVHNLYTILRGGVVGSRN